MFQTHTGQLGALSKLWSMLWTWVPVRLSGYLGLRKLLSVNKPWGMQQIVRRVALLHGDNKLPEMLRTLYLDVFL